MASTCVHRDRQSKLKLEENYSVKQQSLIDSCAAELRVILTQKKDKWMSASNSDQATFIASHPHKNWRPIEKPKILSWELEEFDLPLCAKWLIEFRWAPHEIKLTKTETEAIDELRNIRNNISHKGGPSSVKKIHFEASSQIVRHSLQILGLEETKIEAIIVTANALTLVDKAKMLAEIQTLTDREWRFETLGVLGGGSFGVVLKVRNFVDKSCTALKLIPTQGEDRFQFNEANLREARNWASLGSHCNIVKYITSNYFQLSTQKFQEVINWSEDSSQGNIPSTTRMLLSSCMYESLNLSGCYIQTEVCGETLRNWLDAVVTGAAQPSDADKRRICEDILNALNFIHNGNPNNIIVHRDLRPENIFFAKAEFELPVKIGDFGLSSSLTAAASVATQTAQIGNSLYRAPEIDSQPSTSTASAKVRYGAAVDLFSAGLIFAEVFDPVAPVGLKEKFAQICYKRNTGLVIQEKYERVSISVLKLTEQNPGQRHQINSDGRYELLAWDETSPSTISPAIPVPLPVQQVHYCPNCDEASMSSDYDVSPRYSPDYSLSDEDDEMDYTWRRRQDDDDDEMDDHEEYSQDDDDNSLDDMEDQTLNDSEDENEDYLEDDDEIENHVFALINHDHADDDYTQNDMEDQMLGHSEDAVDDPDLEDDAENQMTPDDEDDDDDDDKPTPRLDLWDFVDSPSVNSDVSDQEDY